MELSSLLSLFINEELYHGQLWIEVGLIHTDKIIGFVTMRAIATLEGKVSPWTSNKGTATIHIFS